MCISKELFIEAIDRIKELHNSHDNAYDVLEAIGIEVSVITNPLEDLVVDLLKNSLHDDNAWIEWFIYENDFGERKLEATSAGGHVMKTDTAEDIYNIITGNPTLIVKENKRKCSCGKECC